ncbi:MAG TPA: ABC transporter ATP-binding protein [Mesotoga infera]|uniref:ABC transporter ATP-binding protein n=1 Tax=Mesotoga infera TaxID=1236046 RepID=A0A7C1CUW1_9BACT|nr:ABC transporter ATP-binding protein [Mesotoga infera]
MVGDLVSSQDLLQIKGLSIHFKTFFGTARAVRDLDLSIGHGEVLGLVGESGCGKSITARAVMGLLKSPPAIIPEGRILYRQKQIFPGDPEVMRRIRGKEISMIFQEPMTSLNPVFRVGKQVVEVMQAHNYGDRDSLRERAIGLFKAVGIPEPEKRFDAYPHQLSGGLRQRVMISMALACKPGLLIADEPTTALDVTIQAQILDIILKMRAEYGMAVMIITHDLGVISQLADRVNVMYAGKIVEDAPVGEILASPAHPYTKGLIASIPDIEIPHSRDFRLNALRGVVPELYEIPPGCPFSNRCPDVFDECNLIDPSLEEISSEHRVACLLYSREMRGGN